MTERHHLRTTQTHQPSLEAHERAAPGPLRLLTAFAWAGILIAGWLWGPADALADLAKAKQFAASAMKEFHKRKYMASVRLHGQAIGELPDNAHADRARSLFYIGLCYHRLKYKAYAVGAWKRFLNEIKKVPNAAQNKDWAIKIRLAREVTSPKSAAPRRRPPADPGQPKDPGVTQPDPPPSDRKRPDPRAPGDPTNNHNVSMSPRPKTTPLWLSNVRRCLRYRARSAQAASRRLRYCRDRMPSGSQCNARCRVVKKKIDRKIKQLEQRDRGDNAPRDQWLDQPGDNNGTYGGNDPGNDYNKGSSYTRKRYRHKRRRSPMYAIATTTSLIGVGAGLLGLGLWIYSGSLVSERNDLMNGKPSPANTSAIIQKHDQAQGMQVAALVSFSAAGAAVLLGSLFFTIAKRTSYQRISQRTTRPSPNKRAVARGTTPPPSGSTGAVTLFSTGLQP